MFFSILLFHGSLLLLLLSAPLFFIFPLHALKKLSITFDLLLSFVANELRGYMLSRSGGNKTLGVC